MPSRELWMDAVIDAPVGARCSLCQSSVKSYDYVWRMNVPGDGDFWVEYAHRKCAGTEGNARDA